MNAIKRKLRSRKGASMSFALLIFLVCAVVSASVIVASSAAAGRMSERAATDQRYYAVTSAAGLLKSDFDGVKATVEYIRTDSGTTTPATTELIRGGTALKPEDCPLISDASSRLVSKLAGNTLDPASRAFTLSCGETATGAKLDCELVEHVDAGQKQLTYEIRNLTDASGGNQVVYTLCATFNANVSRSELQVKLATGGTQTRVTTTVVWTLGSIRKGAYSD